MNLDYSVILSNVYTYDIIMSLEKTGSALKKTSPKNVPPGVKRNEIGILYQPEMAHAVMAGHKTLTRRILSRLPGLGRIVALHQAEAGHWAVRDEKSVLHQMSDMQLMALCPYGKPGDRLFVREAHYQWGWWTENGVNANGKPRMEFRGDPNRIEFERPAQLKADRTAGQSDAGWWKRNSLFMPKVATRTWLEVIEVRVEPLEHLSEADAMAEGILRFETPDAQWFALDSTDPVQEATAISRYRKLWCAINGEESWDENPLVWVVWFRKVVT